MYMISFINSRCCRIEAPPTVVTVQSWTGGATDNGINEFRAESV